MSGPDLVSSMLQGSGFERITFERHDADICIGRNLDEAIEFAMALGPAGEIIRLAGDEGKRLSSQVREPCVKRSGSSRANGGSGHPRAPGSSPRAILRSDLGEEGRLIERGSMKVTTRVSGKFGMSDMFDVSWKGNSQHWAGGSSPLFG
jgi:hypothetical protein